MEHKELNGNGTILKTDRGESHQPISENKNDEKPDKKPFEVPTSKRKGGGVDQIDQNKMPKVPIRKLRLKRQPEGKNKGYNSLQEENYAKDEQQH